jgi:hypothetical protein
MNKSIKSFLARRKVKKTFRKMVSPAVVNEILEGKLTSKEVGQLREKTLGIVLVLVRYSSLAEVAKNIEIAASLAHEYGASCDAVTNGLMVFCYGGTPDGQNTDEGRRAFVEALRAKLGKSVKIVHGTGTGLVGLVGSEPVLSYTFLVPKFNDALRLMFSLQDGELKEIAFS